MIFALTVSLNSFDWSLFQRVGHRSTETLHFELNDPTRQETSENTRNIR